MLSNEDAIRILDTVESRQRVCQSGVTVCILSDLGQCISRLHDNFTHHSSSLLSISLARRIDTFYSIVKNLRQTFQREQQRTKKSVRTVWVTYWKGWLRGIPPRGKELRQKGTLYSRS